MPQFTKLAIKSSFIKLLNEKPLSKITVKDIVEDCQINRNSFYYHFQDIPSLLEEIVTEQAKSIIDRYPMIDSLEECLDVALRFAMDNKRAVQHIYNSVNRDILERYMFDVCHYLVKTYLNNTLKENNIADSDREVIESYYRCLFIGFILDWLKNGMTGDIIDKFHRVCKLRQGSLELMLSRCDKK